MIWQRFLRWLAPLFVIGACWLPSAHAQRYSTPAEPESGRTPALPYTAAFAATLLMLVIVCTPSRKQ